MGRVWQTQEETLSAEENIRHYSKCRVGRCNLTPFNRVHPRIVARGEGNTSHPERAPCCLKTNKCQPNNICELITVSNMDSDDNNIASSANVLIEEEGSQQLSDQQLEQLQLEPQVRLRPIRPTSQLSKPRKENPREGASDKDKLHQKLLYISDRTKRWMADNIYAYGNDTWKCKVCHWKGSKCRVQIHVKRHVIQMYCKCRYNRIS